MDYNAVMSSPRPLRTRAPGRREEVQGQIRAALFALLETRSLTELSIDDIAQAAGISRSAFYFYFRDKYDILEPAADEVARLLFAEADRWFSGEGAPVELVHDALTGVLALYKEHATLLRAIAEAAAYDEEVREFWWGIVDRFIQATARRLEKERREGCGRDLDPQRTATCLIWMVERIAHVLVVRGDSEVEEVVDSLTPVWLAVAYHGTI